MLGGLRVQEKQFIDCSYEGDLLAAAGVSFTVRRESNAQYGETLNGVQCREKHQSVLAYVDPFVVEGDASLDLLPLVESRDLRRDQGKADHKLQAYCFRMCMTNDPSLKIDWEKPEGYDPLQYELAAQRFCHHKPGDWNAAVAVNKQGQPVGLPNKFDVLDRRTPGGFRKTDTNNHCPCSSDFVGANYAWTLADLGRQREDFSGACAISEGSLLVHGER
jgi:hypothetical protein